MPPADSQKPRSVRGTGSGSEVSALARNMFRDLMNAGYESRDVITFATELLDLVLASIRCAKSDAAAPRPPRSAADEEK